MEDILHWFIKLWFITFPLTIFITYTLVTEFLDFIFNTRKINQLLKHSDLLNSGPLDKEYSAVKGRQTKLSYSNLMELDRQINYNKVVKNKESWKHGISKVEIEKVNSAKEISDVFKLK